MSLTDATMPPLLHARLSLTSHDGAIVPLLSDSHSKLVEYLQAEGLELLSTSTDNEWIIYTKGYSVSEQAANDGGNNMHPGYNLNAFLEAKQFEDLVRTLNKSSVDDFRAFMDESTVAIIDRVCGEAPMLALGFKEDAKLPPEDGKVTNVEFEGDRVALEHLGPVVLNIDGSMSRISNWQEMTPAEQANTQRIVAKRNAKRRAALLAAQADNRDVEQ